MLTITCYKVCKWKVANIYAPIRGGSASVYATLAAHAPAGRMALTNYLLQSLVGALVFTAYGLALVGQVSPGWVVLGVLVLYATQLAWSHRWMATHAYGPVEWLLRAFTQWQWPAWRRVPA